MPTTMNQLSCSPALKVLYPIDAPPNFNPFGGSRAFNALDSFLGTPDIVTKVSNQTQMYLELAFVN